MVFDRPQSRIELNRHMSYRLTASFCHICSGEATESVSNAAAQNSIGPFFFQTTLKPQGAMYGVVCNQVFLVAQQYRQGLLGPGNTETVSYYRFV